ncbi:MAG: helix-turn-helix domain-containing protein [Oscillospiraceae bacterium]|nr:helix-turn-helix domain-containing protein [Oscillospiraceae bacterium]
MAGRTQRFDSRQSMKNRRFEVFHYRDKKPEFVGVHHHDFYEIYFFLGGKVDFRVEGRSFAMEPGDILLINPSELHQPQIGEEEVYERIVLWIDRSFLESLGGESADLSACFDSSQPGHSNLLRPSKGRRAVLEDMLERMVKEFYSDAAGSELYVQGLLLQFLVEVNRLSKRYSQASLEKASEPDLVSQVLSYIGSHFHEELTLESLAAEFYVSKYHLSHEFSNRVGTSVYRYVIFRRLMQARELLAAGRPPGEAYQLCGFRDYANFYRAFKAEYGVSPSAVSSGEESR